MKTLIPTLLLAVAAFFLVSKSPNEEKAPAGAQEKIISALPAKPYATPAKSRKILVFSKTNGFRHNSIPTGKIAFEEMGKKTGAFQVVISDDLANFERKTLATFDAVCFLNTTQNVFLPHPDQFKELSDDEKKAATELDLKLQKNLMDFIKSGRGFIGIHAATDTCQKWPEYGVMINGYFAGHPWTSNTPVSIKIEPGQESHPLVAMFEGKNIEFKEEIYQLRDPYDSKAVQMLLRLDTEKTDMTVKGINRTDNDFGVSWVRPWGKGRVFYSSLGHNHEIYWHPQVLRHFLAGTQWALGDYKVAQIPVN